MKCDFCAGTATRLVGESNEMSVCSVHALDDDIRFWLSNPFMTPELLGEKVRYWLAGAWDEGWHAGVSDVTRTVGRNPAVNPYREVSS